MRVIGVRRTPRPAPDVADKVLAQADLARALGEADIVALTCPLTPEAHGTYRRRHAGNAEARGAPGQCGAGKGSRRSGASGRASRRTCRRCGARLFRRGATAAQIPLLGSPELADHAARGGRNRVLREKRRRHSQREYRAPPSWRNHAAKPSGVMGGGDTVCAAWPRRTALNCNGTSDYGFGRSFQCAQELWAVSGSFTVSCSGLRTANSLLLLGVRAFFQWCPCCSSPSATSTRPTSTA